MSEYTFSSTHNGYFVYNSEDTKEPEATPTEVFPLDIEGFFNLAFMNYLNEKTEEEIQNEIGLSKEDEAFPEKIFKNPYLKKVNVGINKYLDEQINNSIENAIEGNVPDSYNSYLKFANFSQEENLYILTKEGENASQKLPQYIERRFKNIPNFQTSLKIIKNINDINTFIAYNHSGVHSPINPYQTISNLENLSDTLTEKQMSNEQKAKMYFLAAQMFTERSPYGTESLNTDGLHYTQKAISLSSDYNLISNCLRKLDKKHDKKNLKDAYKRALSKAEKEKNYNHIYVINKKMIEIYSSEKNVGYVNSFNSSHKVEKHYMQAISAMKKAKNHSKEEVNSELRKLFDIQMKNGNNKGAIKSKEEIAHNLKGKDKYNALISIVGIAKEGQLQYVNKISKLINNDKMNLKDKNELLNNLLAETKAKVIDPEKREKGTKLVDRQITYNNLFLTQRTKNSR